MRSLRVHLLLLGVGVSSAAAQTQIAELAPSVPLPSSGYGASVAVSGKRVLIGAPEASGLGTGSAYVVDAATGAELDRIVAQDAAPGDWFGISVALEGTTGLVGAFSKDGLSQGEGAAYLVDVESGQQLAKLVASDPQEFGWFGLAVALSGGLAVCGAPGQDEAYVFDVSTGQQLAKLVGSNTQSGDNFGGGVAIEGDRIYVGASEEDTGGRNGVVYLFDAMSGLELARILPDDADGNSFGLTIAVENGFAVIGAPRDDETDSLAGAAYVFETATLTQLYKLLLGPDSQPKAMMCVDRPDIDGSTVLIGKRFAMTGPPIAEAAFLFDLPTGALVQKIASPLLSVQQFGRGLGLLGDRVCIGAAAAASSVGRTWLYDLEFSAICQSKTNSLGCEPAIRATGTPSMTPPNAYVLTADSELNGRNGLLFYGYGDQPALPFLGGELCVAPPLRRTAVQNSGGTPPPANDCTGTYVFDFGAWMQSGVDPLLVAGQPVAFSYWSRDVQQLDGTGAALTNTITTVIEP